MKESIEPTIQFAVMPNISILPNNMKTTKEKVSNAIPKRKKLTNQTKPIIQFAESLVNLPSVSKPMVKPGPIKTSVSKPMILKEFNKPQKVSTKQIKKLAPVNRRTPSQKVANALAKLPSQKNVDNVVKTLPTKEKRRLANKVEKYKGKSLLLGSTTTSTSTSHDPRDKFRDAGLGASTSTTTSSRTSGAYRFDDPRLMHRWG